MNPASAPSNAELNQLGGMMGSGRFAEVESRARTLLEQFPASGYLWEFLAMSLQQQGKDALHAFQKTAACLPGDAGAQYNLGAILKSSGRLEEAAASYQRALTINPNFAEGHINLGNVLSDLGRHEEAIGCFRRAIQIKPDIVEAYLNLGVALADMKQTQEAIDNYRHAIRLNPAYHQAYSYLASAQMALGQHDGAVASVRQALTLNPNYAEGYNNLGLILSELGKHDEAAASFYRAIQLKPDDADTCFNMANTLQELKQTGQAIAFCRRTIELKPDHAAAHSNLGNLLAFSGQLDEAMASYRRALEIDPGKFSTWSNLLLVTNYTATSAKQSHLDEARKFGAAVANLVGKKYDSWQCGSTPQRLRVGMVSGDLWSHPVGYFLEGLLSHIDTNRIELLAYPTGVKEDSLTARIKPCFSAWKSLEGMDDAEAAAMIQADGVHVLLDLSGHTAYNRLAMFAWKPAPVQACWLGYFATTGVAEMDYYMADLVSVPKDRQQQFTETIWYLPDTRLCFTVPEFEVPVGALPALSADTITFGCFQNLLKVNDAVLETWGKIFAALPNARLRMQCKQLGEPQLKEQFSERLKRHHISPERATLLGPTTRENYLAAHNEVDFILDTFPYPGGTTTCEALWMGVPTLTLAGEGLLARQGASLLTAAGLDDWVTESREEYIAKALALAGDKPGLASLRSELRQQVLASPIFDAPRFARNFEDALWEMWRAHEGRQTIS